jgi:hypothetical protein
MMGIIPLALMFFGAADGAMGMMGIIALALMSFGAADGARGTMAIIGLALMSLALRTALSRPPTGVSMCSDRDPPFAG